MKKFLIIQTAFIGDVILATPLLENLHAAYPNAQIDFLLRKGNEALLTNHPLIHHLFIWDKKKNKYKNLWQIFKQVRAEQYDAVINVQRFFATGIITAFSGAAYTIGFSKNPLSILFTKKIKHVIGTAKNPLHEVERNHALLQDFVSESAAPVKLYPSEKDYADTAPFKSKTYYTISPASVWFTKQWPIVKWVELIHSLPKDVQIYLLGGPDDKELANGIIKLSEHKHIENLCGRFHLLGSAALMKDAQMNFVNDSAPMHLASAMNAPVTAFYCSTMPYFGFGPRSSIQFIAEVKENLSCRPCGLHGKKACPLKHFNCAYEIDVNALIRKVIE